MKVEKMLQFKRDGVLRSTLVEFAKQVSFPDWNVMHGGEITCPNANSKQQTVGRVPYLSDNNNGKTICFESNTTDVNAKESVPFNISNQGISVTVTSFDSFEEEETLIDEIQTDFKDTNNDDKESEVKEETTEKARMCTSQSNSTTLEEDGMSDSSAIQPKDSSTEPKRSNESAFTIVSGLEDQQIQNSVQNLRAMRPDTLTRTRSDSDIFKQEIYERCEAYNKTNEEDLHERRYRKKSMSFAGVLPIKIEVTPHDLKETSSSESATYGRANHMNRQANSWDQKGPKSPRRSRKSLDKKSNDPSHYLGRRRGSYNPSYDQTTVLPTPKSKGRNQRAKSLFVGSSVLEDDFRQSLASRLMKVASPALRESLAENISEEEQGVEVQTQSRRSGSVQIGTSNHTDEAINKASREEKHNVGQKSGALVSPRAIMKRHPWEECPQSPSTGVYPSNDREATFEDDSKKTSAYFSIASNRRAIEADATNLENIDSLQLQQQILQDSLNSSPSKHNGKRKPTRYGKRSSEPKEDSMILRYQRQTRSKSCFGSLEPSVSNHSYLSSGKIASKDECSSESSSSEDDSKENISIHAAAKVGKLKRIKRLVEDGIDVNILDESNWPPIHYALLGGHFNCVAFLLTKGADIRHYSKGRTLKYFR